MNTHRTSGYPQEATPSTGAGATQGCQGATGGLPTALSTIGATSRMPPVSPTLDPHAVAPDTYVGDGAAVRDGALGGDPCAGGALGDASAWNRAQRRPWKTGDTGLRDGPRATLIMLLVTCKFHPLQSRCLNAESPCPYMERETLGKRGCQTLWELTLFSRFWIRGPILASTLPRMEGQPQG